MDEPTTEQAQDARVTENGHRPTSQEQKWAIMGHDELATTLIDKIHENPYSTARLLHQDTFKQRLAEVLRDDPAIFHGDIVFAANALLQPQTREWIREIERLVRAMPEEVETAVTTPAPRPPLAPPLPRSASLDPTLADHSAP